jgi:hypothetical protein
VLSLSAETSVWLSYHLCRAFFALIVISIVGINALYVRNGWVIVSSCIVGLPFPVSLFYLHEPQPLRSSAKKSTTEHSAPEKSTAGEDAEFYTFAILSLLGHAGIILALTTIYVPERPVTLAAWILLLLGSAVGGFSGWRMETVPYVEPEEIERNWWLVVERFFIGNEKPVAEV